MILIGSRLAEAARSGDRKCSVRNYQIVQLEYAVPIIRALLKAIRKATIIKSRITVTFERLACKPRVHLQK